MSKRVVDKKTDTATLFAFCEGQGLSEYATPFDVFVCILDSEARVTITGKSHELKRGEAVLMPAHEPHALEGPSRFRMM